MEYMEGLEKHPYLQQQMQKTENAIKAADAEDAAAALRRALEYITMQYVCREYQELQGASLYEVIRGLGECGAESRQVIELWDDIRIFGNRCGAHQNGGGSLNKAEYLFKDLILYLPSFLEKFPEPGEETMYGEEETEPAAGAKPKEEPEAGAKPEEEPEAGVKPEKETAAGAGKAAGPETAGGVIAGGYCGNKETNLRWQLDQAGVLTISGKGQMADFRPGRDVKQVKKRGLLGTKTEGPIPWRDYKDKIKKAVIQEGVKNVGKAAFWECRELESVILPESLWKIGMEAFAYCSRLNYVKLPQLLTELGDAAFWNCESLEEMVIPGTVVFIRKWNFAGCEKLRRAVFTDNIAYIGTAVFSWCENLTIEAPADSLALQYAKMYKIAYKVIGMS